MSKEEQDLIWESDEPEEFAAEEFEAKDEDYFHEIPNDRQDRRRLRRFKSDSVNEWEPYTGAEWEPDTGRPWKPFLLDR